MKNITIFEKNAPTPTSMFSQTKLFGRGSSALGKRTLASRLLFFNFFASPARKTNMDL